MHQPSPFLLLCTSGHVLHPSEQDEHPLSSPERRHFGGDVLGAPLSGEGLRGGNSRKRRLSRHLVEESRSAKSHRITGALHGSTQLAFHLHEPLL